MKLNYKSINYGVESIAALEGVAGVEGNTVVVTDENRGGVFVYREDNVGTNNGGTIFNGWTRQYDGAVNIKWFGAVGDGTTDDTVAIQNAIDSLGYIGGEVFLPVGVYKVTNLVINEVYTMSLRGTGATTILFAGSDDSWGLIAEHADTFGNIRISDIKFVGVAGTASVNGIHCKMMHNSEFRNLTFKWLNTCIRGEHLYASTFDNILFDEYQIGIRGLTESEAIAKSYSHAEAAPLADCHFQNLDFWDGSSLVSESYAIVSTGLNSNSFNTCIFGGTNSNGVDLTSGYGGLTFTHCRFERMKPNVSWIKLGSFSYFYNCVAYTDGNNCWWTLSDSTSDTWLFDISGEGNVIDGISPEYPWHIVKFRRGSRNNDFTWIPAQSNNWLSSNYFVAPIMDFGLFNNIKIRDFDFIKNNTASTKGGVLNMLTNSNNQASFGLDGLTQTHTPTVYSKGPYMNEAVYKYSSPTGYRRAVTLVSGLTPNYWYTFSFWVATNNYALLGTVEIILGEEVSDSYSYAPFTMDASGMWVRVSKSFKAESTDMYCGWRMAADATADLYISQPQLTECGSTQDSIFIGAYVPTNNTMAYTRDPSIHTAKNLVDKTSSRFLGTTYTNTSGKEIIVYIRSYSNTSNAACTVYINGIAVSSEQSPTGLDVSLMFTVRPGETYKVNWSATPVLTTWYENI